MPKLVINNSELAEAFFDDARLLGIQCPQPPHALIWQINRSFGYNFAYLVQGEIILQDMGRKYQYPIYTCREAQLELEHLLYVNGHDGKHLLPELRHIDYLWLLKGAGAQPAFTALLMQELRALSGITLVLELTNEKIKHKEHLVL